MPSPVTATAAINFGLLRAVLDGIDQQAGLLASDGFTFILPDGSDVHFHRVFLPENAEVNTLSSPGLELDTFKFDTFPGLENNTSGDPVLDLQGLPLNFATVQLIAFDVRPIRPFLGVYATGTLTSNNTNVSDADTVTIGSTVYTFKTTLTPTAGEVLIGADADASLLNLIRAINYSGTPGTHYVGTAPHPTVRAATAVTAHAFLLTALQPGTAGNALATTGTAATLSFTAATLTGGEERDPNNIPRGLEGTVRLILSDGILGTGSSTDITFAEPGLHLIACHWTPAAGGKIQITFETTEPLPATSLSVNAAATLLLIGKNA